MEKLIKTFKDSLSGFVIAYDNEKAFREDLMIFILFFPLALITDTTGTQKALLVASLFIILIAELACTAIEVIVDKLVKEKNQFTKKAKDIGNSLVMLSLINAAITWALIFFT